MRVGPTAGMPARPLSPCPVSGSPPRLRLQLFSFAVKHEAATPALLQGGNDGGRIHPPRTRQAVRLAIRDRVGRSNAPRENVT